MIGEMIPFSHLEVTGSRKFVNFQKASLVVIFQSCPTSAYKKIPSDILYIDSPVTMVCVAVPHVALDDIQFEQIENEPGKGLH